MSSLVENATIKIRRDSAANWTSNNPTPASGEMCYESDTGYLKIGDGSTAWNSLEYVARPDKNIDDDSKRIARAWVNFNGTGTVAIRDSYNVSSITDNGVGDYTINFTTPLADANYTSCVNIVATLTTGGGTSMPFHITESQSATSVSVATFSYTGSTNTTSRVDQAEICVVVF